MDDLKRRAKQLKREVSALALAYKDPRTPWYARAVVAVIVIYAISPIDLIPDFVPVLGYLDDLILVPLGIALALRLIPPNVMAECREQALLAEGRPTSWVGAIIIVAIWLISASFVGLLVWRAVR